MANSFLCVLVIFLAFHHHASATAIQDVCNGALDHAFCLRILGSDPRSATADFRMFAQIALDLASTKGSATKAKVHTLFLSAKDPNFRARFGMCEKYYADAMDVLRTGQEDLRKLEFRTLFDHSVGAEDDALACEEQFTKPRTGPVLKSPLTGDNNDMSNLCNILSVVANILDH